MRTSRTMEWQHRLVSRGAAAGSILSGVSLAAGLFVMTRPVVVPLAAADRGT